MFKENLISLRKLNHMSQEELAEKLGISRQTLSKYETGESIPDIERSKAIADAFGVSLDELVNYENGSGQPSGASEGQTRLRCGKSRGKGADRYSGKGKKGV